MQRTLGYTITLEYYNSYCSGRSYTSGSTLVNYYAAEFWAASFLLSSPFLPPPCFNMSTVKSQACPYRRCSQERSLPVTMASQSPGERLAAFLSCRVISTKVRKERNWLVSNRISKHCELILCPKCKCVLPLAGEEHEEVWNKDQISVKCLSNCVFAVYFCNFI